MPEDEDEINFNKRQKMQHHTRLVAVCFGPIFDVGAALKRPADRAAAEELQKYAARPFCGEYPLRQAHPRVACPCTSPSLLSLARE